MADEDEVEETEEEEEEQEYLFGIPIPDVDEGIQPIECLILVKGVRMEDGSPTMTAMGSAGITPWEAVGMMSLEIERLKFMSVYASVGNQEDDDDII